MFACFIGILVIVRLAPNSIRCHNWVFECTVRVILKQTTCQMLITSVKFFVLFFRHKSFVVWIYTKWQSWWSIQPIIRTVIIISSPLFMPWNITARKAKRWPKGGSNTGGNEHIDCICGFMHPFDLINVAEFRISPFWPTRCNVTSDTRLWFQPMMKLTIFFYQFIYFRDCFAMTNRFHNGANNSEKHIEMLVMLQH